MLQEDVWYIIQRTQNEYAWQQVNILAGRHELILSTVKYSDRHLHRNDDSDWPVSSLTVMCRKLS